MNRIKNKEQRLRLCNECEHKQYLLSNVTCGTPIIGSTIQHEGKTINLCGCVMKFKTLIPQSNCPIKKW